VNPVNVEERANGSHSLGPINKSHEDDGKDNLDPEWREAHESQHHEKQQQTHHVPPKDMSMDGEEKRGL